MAHPTATPADSGAVSLNKPKRPAAPGQQQAKAATGLSADEFRKYFDRLERIEQQQAEILKAAKPQYPEGAAPDRLFAQPKDPEEELKYGFKSFGDYLREVKASGQKTGPTDRMKKYLEYVGKAATGMGEAIGSDGGFLVPPTFSTTLLQRVYDNDLLKRTQSFPTPGNSLTIPRTAETSRATGSRYGGVRAYWVDEGSSITASAPTFGQLQLVLHKLACLARVTAELLEDAQVVSLEQYLQMVFASEIEFMIGNAIVRGTGGGQPLGILNADCTVSVAKETGQAAATIVYANIVKMWQRLYAPSQAGAIWLINQDVLQQLYSLALDVGTGGLPAYLPPGGLSASPYATLMGKPVIPVEFCSTLGTVGDIILCDLGQYVTLTKSTGMKTQTSLHVYFATDEEAFRVTMRIDGQPWWPAALTPFQGSNTLSPFITLANRS